MIDAGQPATPGDLYYDILVPALASTRSMSDRWHLVSDAAMRLSAMSGRLPALAALLIALGAAGQWAGSPGSQFAGREGGRPSSSASPR